MGTYNWPKEGTISLVNTMFSSQKRTQTLKSDELILTDTAENIMCWDKKSKIKYGQNGYLPETEHRTLDLPDSHAFWKHDVKPLSYCYITSKLPAEDKQYEKWIDEWYCKFYKSGLSWTFYHIEMFKLNC